MAAAERKSDFKHTPDTPYLALTGELWGVYCEDLGENWPRYNGTELYFVNWYPILSTPTAYIPLHDTLR